MKLKDGFVNMQTSFRIGDLVADKYGFTGLIRSITYEQEYRYFQIEWHDHQGSIGWYGEDEVEDLVNYVKQI